ncbi:endo-1-3(4)-beta-glucanase [Apiospora arundinis]
MVEYQKGHLIRRISQLRAPNSRFGPAIAVLGGSVTFSSDTSIAGGGGGGLPPLAPPVGSNGSETWSTAFQAMMEESLRDGEDTSITLPYTPIRRHVNRLSHTLDDVVESCLVLLDAGSDANVLVARSNKKDNAQSPGHILDGPVSSGTEYYVENNASPRAPSSSSSPQHSPPSSTSPEKAIARIRVSGLQDWSNCIFGDPLMVDVFSRNPSDDFLRGFRGQPPASAPMEIPSGSQATSTTSLPPTPMNTPESTSPPTVIKMPSKPQFLPLTPYLSSSLPPPTPHSLMPGGATIGGFSGDWASHRSGGSGDDERVANRSTLDGEDSNAAIRLLLYECYHATVCVVKQFYRPSPPESTQRELAARRRLAEVLRKLELVQQHGPIAATSRSGGSSSSSTSNSGNDTGSGMGDNNRRPKSRRASEWDDEDANEWPTKRARSGARDH